MKSTHPLIITLLQLTFITGAFAQSATSGGCYGSDPLLYNGTLYRFYVSTKTTGTQFFSRQEFTEGSVKIRGTLYYNELLNYDVYNQQLVMEYTAPGGGIDKLAISDAWLEGFSINSDTFEVYPSGDTISKIYRVVGTDSLKVFYHYTRDLVLGSGVSALNMRFTPLIIVTYFFNGHNLQRYKGNKTFISLFPDAKQAELRRFMRTNNINVKKAGDDQMNTLLQYCKSLYL